MFIFQKFTQIAQSLRKKREERMCFPASFLELSDRVTFASDRVTGNIFHLAKFISSHPVTCKQFTR